MRLLLLLLTMVAGAVAAGPTLKVQSMPSLISSDAVKPNLMPGIAGVGAQVAGDSLPCIGCYGAPANSLVVPPPYYIIAQATQPGLIYYCSVETGNLSGSGTISVTVKEAATGKVVQTLMNDYSDFPAHSTTMLAWDTQLPNDDGYKGLETLVFTVTIGQYTVSSSARIWVVSRVPTN